MFRISLALAIAIGLAAVFPRSAGAMPDSNWTIYASQFPDQARFFAAPLGNTDPFGNPAPTGCKWSRLQIPTFQGLEWAAVEDCNP